MNPFGWKKWKELPYRGDGEPRSSKRKRRYINLRKEKWKTVTSIFWVIVLFAVIFVFIAFDPNTTHDNSTKIVVGVIGLILALTFVAGILSLNRFREGYDVDISDEDRNEKDDSR